MNSAKSKLNFCLSALAGLIIVMMQLLICHCPGLDLILAYFLLLPAFWISLNAVITAFSRRILQLRIATALIILLFTITIYGPLLLLLSEKKCWSYGLVYPEIVVSILVAYSISLAAGFYLLQCKSTYTDRPVIILRRYLQKIKIYEQSSDGYIIFISKFVILSITLYFILGSNYFLLGCVRYLTNLAVIFIPLLIFFLCQQYISNSLALKHLWIFGAVILSSLYTIALNSKSIFVLIVESFLISILLLYIPRLKSVINGFFRLKPSRKAIVAVALVLLNSNIFLFGHFVYKHFNSLSERIYYVRQYRQPSVYGSSTRPADMLALTLGVTQIESNTVETKITTDSEHWNAFVHALPKVSDERLKGWHEQVSSNGFISRIFSYKYLDLAVRDGLFSSNTASIKTIKKDSIIRLISTFPQPILNVIRPHLALQKKSVNSYSIGDLMYVSSTGYMSALGGFRQSSSLVNALILFGPIAPVVWICNLLIVVSLIFLFVSPVPGSSRIEGFSPFLIILLPEVLSIIVFSQVSADLLPFILRRLPQLILIYTASLWFYGATSRIDFRRNRT